MSHGGNEKPEKGNLLVFTVVTFLAVYGVFFLSFKAYEHGTKEGAVERVINPPVERKTGDAPPPKIYDLRELRKPTPELIAQGAKVFAANCASCHGETGHGDGAAGQRLAVKPRNFTTAAVSEYKNGPSPLKMFKTLSEGVGGNMPSFPVLNSEQKFAAIHYVRENFIAHKTEDSKEDIDAIPAPAAEASGPLVVADMGPRVSIDFALAQYVQPDDRPFHRAEKVDPESGKTLGARLYLAHCASCHGPDGKGGIPYDSINLVPKLPMRAQALSASQGKWTTDSAEFTSIVTKGLPGRLKPGIAIFTKDEMDALYKHTLGLARGRETAASK